MQHTSSSSDIRSGQRITGSAADENALVSLSGQIQQSMHQQWMVGARSVYTIMQKITKHVLNGYKQVAQLSQRDRGAGWVICGQKWKGIYGRQYRSIFNYCGVIGLQSYRIR